MKWFGLAIISCAALSLAAMDEAAAGGRGGPGRSSGASRGASHPGGHSHHNHRHSHHHFRSSLFVGFGAPLFWGPSYYYAPGYYEPLPVYIEQNSESPEQDSQDWYYCPSARTYYPYVGDCPEGWQRVLPQPNPQPSAG